MCDTSVSHAWYKGLSAVPMLASKIFNTRLASATVSTVCTSSLKPVAMSPSSLGIAAVLPLVLAAL